MNNINEIIFVSINYFTQLDKVLLFEWIDAIPSVESYKNEDDQLSIIPKQDVTDQDLLDLLAICVRYKLSINKLSDYMYKDNEYWWTGPKFQVIYPQLNKDKKELLDKNRDFLRLDCTPVDLYTLLDKNNMFTWMERIPCVKDIVGLGPVIYLYIEAKEVSPQALLKLEGLFSRYDFDVAQFGSLLAGN